MTDAPLPSQTLTESASLELAPRASPRWVKLDSPASEVMTEVAELSAATVMPDEGLDWAEQRLDQQGVRVLLVMAEMPRVLGILALEDLHGEKLLQRTAERRLTHRDMRVADLMQPVSQLDAVDYRAFSHASVGQVLTTLLRSGQPHLLVVESGGAPATFRLRGLVSRSQVERQLGTRLPLIPVADTFAQIEQALA